MSDLDIAPSVSGFVRRIIERSGGVVEEVEPGLFEALLPPPLETLVVSEPLVALALDADAIASHPDARLATVGSPFMDALIGYASERGVAVVGWIVVDRLRRKGIREELERAVVFTNCRVRYDPADPDILTDAYLQLNYRVTFFSEERRERLYVIPISSHTGRPTFDLVPLLPRLEIDDKKLLGVIDAPRRPVESVLASAREALRAKVAEEVERRQEHSRRRFAAEASRIAAYYDQTARDLERRLARADDEKKRESIASKIDATRIERERKLRELGETYRLRIRARLANARLLYQQKSYYKIHLDRGKTTRTITVAYDSVLDRVEPPACDVCDRVTGRLSLSIEGRLECPECFTK